MTWYGGGGGRLFLLEKRGRTVYGPNIPYAIDRSPKSECWHTHGGLVLALLRGISRSEFVLPQRGGSRERELDPAEGSKH